MRARVRLARAQCRFARSTEGVAGRLSSATRLVAWLRVLATTRPRCGPTGPMATGSICASENVCRLRALCTSSARGSPARRGRIDCPCCLQSTRSPGTSWVRGRRGRRVRRAGRAPSIRARLGRGAACRNGLGCRRRRCRVRGGGGRVGYLLARDDVDGRGLHRLAVDLQDREPAGGESRPGVDPPPSTVAADLPSDVVSRDDSRGRR